MPRKTNTIPAKKTILLVVEGETEKIYFSQMKSAENNQHVTIIPRMAKYSSPIRIIEDAIKAASDNVYDSIWCIFDRDVFINDKISDDLERKINLAKKKKVKFADSLPAFEIWFLLHYCIPKQFYKNQDELITELKKHIANYQKNKDWLARVNLYNMLKDYIENAISNNKKLEQRNNEIQDSNVSMCNVYKLIQEIFEE